MVGLVLYQDLLLNGRRLRLHWLRWLYVGWLVVQTTIVLLTYTIDQGPRNRTLRDLAEFSRFHATLLLMQHFILQTLITPVLTASALCDEKWRGTLQFLLTSDLLSWEILIGKLLARMVQVLMALFPVLPVLCFVSVFSGMPLNLLLGLLGASVLVLFGLAGASLLASVWCRHTRDAVLGLFTIGAILYGLGQGHLLAYAPGALPEWLDGLLQAADPIQPLGRDWWTLEAAQLGRRLFWCAIWWIGVGTVSLIVATLLLRRVCVRQMEAAGAVRKPFLGRWLFFKTGQRPEVPDQPLGWKERYVEGIAPLTMFRQMPGWLGVMLIVLAAICSSGTMLLLNLPPTIRPAVFLQKLLAGDFDLVLTALRGMKDAEPAFYAQGVVVMLVASLIVGMRCSGAITSEREKQTWESLLLTPLETRAILRGKLWGIIGASAPYLLAYAIPALVISAMAGVWCFFWTVLWLGVTLMALFYVGAAGLWCSARSKSSWWSLLGTLAFIYLGGAVLAGATFLFGCLLGLVIFVGLAFIDLVLQVSGFRTNFTAGPGDITNPLAIGFCLALAAGFGIVAYRLLLGAEYYINILERTKPWRHEHLQLPRRRDRTRVPEPGRRR